MEYETLEAYILNRVSELERENELYKREIERSHKEIDTLGKRNKELEENLSAEVEKQIEKEIKQFEITKKGLNTTIKNLREKLKERNIIF